MQITLFTPTYNRSGTLPRLYQSLLNQSFKDFKWLIIDDGSNDNTHDLVTNWIHERKIEIEYHYKQNGGKHTAMQMAYRLAETKYFTAIDSDDELTIDAIEVFKNEWAKIEKADFQHKFAEISALTHSPDRKLIGDFYFPSGIEYIDSYWHEMVLKYKNNNEHTICWNLEKLKECVEIPEKFWLQDKVSVFGEHILWARIGRKYQTRYINKCLRIYHVDAGDSLQRINDKTKGHFNNLVSQKYFLDENLDYFFWNPHYFFNLILKFIVSAIELKKPVFELLKVIDSWRLLFAYIVCLPIGIFMYIYFKYIKRRFWF